MTKTTVHIMLLITGLMLGMSPTGSNFGEWGILMVIAGGVWLIFLGKEVPSEINTAFTLTSIPFGVFCLWHAILGQPAEGEVIPVGVAGIWTLAWAAATLIKSRQTVSTDS